MVRVSVIIPVYNAAQWLGACLDSVLSQSLRDIEVICIDDGSTDSSPSILGTYQLADRRVRVIHQENAGQGMARNRGLEAATGDYVYFMDADDALAGPDVLERLVAEAGRERLDVLAFDAETAVDEGRIGNAVRAETYIRRHDYSDVCPGREFFSRLLKNREYSASPCLVLLRRSFLAEHALRFPGENIFYEDELFMPQVLLAAKRASHRPWRCYVRNVHAGSTVMSSPTMRHLRGSLACYADSLRLLAMAGWDWRMRWALADRCALHKLRVRRIVDGYPALLAAAGDELSPEESGQLREIRNYPFREKVANGFRCLRDNGFVYTLRRIFLGRPQP